MDYLTQLWWLRLKWHKTIVLDARVNLLLIDYKRCTQVDWRLGNKYDIL